jgi:uncharacterized protein YcfJ
MSKARVCGSLVAAVLGDCIGGMFEGGPAQEMATVLKPVRKFEEGECVFPFFLACNLESN